MVHHYLNTLNWVVLETFSSQKTFTVQTLCKKFLELFFHYAPQGSANGIQAIFRGLEKIIQIASSSCGLLDVTNSGISTFMPSM